MDDNNDVVRYVSRSRQNYVASKKIPLNIMCYQCIKDSFYYGKFGDFKIVVDKDTGYFNATKLCEQGGKEYNVWTCLDTTKNMLSYYYENRLGDMYIGYVIEGNDEDKLAKRITGTYLPKELFLNIASWISFDFYDKCNNIIIDHYVKKLAYMEEEEDNTTVKKMEEQMETLTLKTNKEIHRQNHKIKKLQDMVNGLDKSNQHLEQYIKSLSQSLTYIIDQNEKLILNQKKTFYGGG